MAIVYFDSGAFVKLVVEEEGSDLAAALASPRAASPWRSSRCSTWPPPRTHTAYSSRATYGASWSCACEWRCASTVDPAGAATGRSRAQRVVLGRPRRLDGADLHASGRPRPPIARLEPHAVQPVRCRNCAPPSQRRNRIAGDDPDPRQRGRQGRDIPRIHGEDDRRVTGRTGRHDVSVCDPFTSGAGIVQDCADELGQPLVRGQDPDRLPPWLRLRAASTRRVRAVPRHTSARVTAAQRISPPLSIVLRSSARTPIPRGSSITSKAAASITTAALTRRSLRQPRLAYAIGA